jgi:hypothetical protein
MTSAPTDASDSYAAEVARLLWPAPWEEPYVTHSRHRAGESHRDAYLFPSRRRPRLLVPADLPGSSSMLHLLGARRSAFVGPLRSLLETSVRSRAFALARWPMLRVPSTEPGADSIESYLAECFGTEVRVGVMLGTRRVNQKPVLQVFDLTGRLRGYAKVGSNRLTAGLVRREARSLKEVGGQSPQTFQLPRLLHHGQWSGLEILVISPLSTDPRQRVPAATRLAAMREVARLGGTTEQPLGGSSFWERTQLSSDLLSEEWEGLRLQSAVRAIGETHAPDRLRFGGWHGDWGRWNMGMGEGVLKLWDWERYEADVPIGFDALHFAAQSVRPGERHDRRQEVTFLRGAPEALARLGVPSDQHDLVLRLYLLSTAARYVEALTHGGTPVLRRRTTWVLSLLERLSDHSVPTPPEGRP